MYDNVFLELSVSHLCWWECNATIHCDTDHLSNNSFAALADFVFRASRFINGSRMRAVHIGACASRDYRIRIVLVLACHV